ncbi:hypothetical protein DRN87_06100 [Candidatus Geothermarchaeota archaeon]|nr:MAG: hypothetical protein DRN87_06100 [Candidatus Geothermarchaeota archaeon]
MEFRWLDIGCGDNPRGTVNVDKYLISPEIRLSKVETEADVIADVEKGLPFPDKSFEIVTAYHVLEHTENILKALLELIRVSNYLVIIRVPHRLSRYNKLPYHRHQYLNVKFFKRILEKLKKYRVIRAYDIEVHYKPHVKYFLQLPDEIEVFIWV